MIDLPNKANTAQIGTDYIYSDQTNDLVMWLREDFVMQTIGEVGDRFTPNGLVKTAFLQLVKELQRDAP